MVSANTLHGPFVFEDVDDIQNTLYICLTHLTVVGLALVKSMTTGFALEALLGWLELAVGLAHQARLLSLCLVWFVGHLSIEASVIGFESIFAHHMYLSSRLLSALATAPAGCGHITEATAWQTNSHQENPHHRRAAEG